MILRAASCVSMAALCVFSIPLAQAQSGEGGQVPASREVQSERRLDILNYQVEGNTVLSRTQVEQAVMPYLGPQRPVSDVDAARQSLMDAYHAEGFETVNVIIPAQDVRGGIVRLQVVEMRVGRLRVAGAQYHSPQDIREDIPALSEGEVPNYNDVSTQLAGLNRSRDRLVTPTLRAGTQPNTVDVDLLVEDELPLHGSIEINDRASSNTKRHKVSGSISYGNLFQRGHSLNLQGQFSPEKPEESWVVSASYVVPLQTVPLTFVGYAVHTDSDVAAIGGINVLGKGNIFGLRGIYSLVSGEPTSPRIHQFTFGIDYKDFEENLFAEEGNPSRTPIDYFPLMVEYGQSKQTARYEFSFGIGAAVGLRGLSSRDDEFGNKRYGANANWSALRGNISYLHKLDNDWHLGGSLSGQYAGEPVISNEQFAIGGVDSVRGYYESFQIGDDGVAAQLQVTTPSFAERLGEKVQDLRVYAFADGGYVRIHEPLSVQDESSELYSLGLGVKLRAFEGFNAQMSLARPFLNEQTTLRDVGDFRLQFRVWNEF
ncbi:ShlB/FhaC/HecB family hemolysin secretion/activation protein [Woodsholea maritima]|uniref:ShlB/FhaC/HecB family hemolysin secretion/activation protein n=1 Tax=Woodsholea maritima TaxID=240237 RepID=UPI000368183B|nr:ShlB/FhaC/HecB family hemolysin secretion/activation protein [Woodsholea maritima]